MISTGLMLFLLVVYAAILLASLWERNWNRALYWAGAILIMVAVLRMSPARKQVCKPDQAIESGTNGS